ncbi:MAG TPA: zf-HC2 domain-containing protein [Clostridia bacterium]|nr:zf-HC2 domain-containing protein [Clostridia bacterium]
MHCKEISNLVMKYFDGNISELEREMIIRHNESCSSCAEEFTVLREAMDALEDFCEIDVPLGFESKVMEEIRAWKPYSLNPKIVLFWLISVLGLMVFSWNMAVFVAVPLIRESGILIAAQNVIIYGVSVVSDILYQLLVTASVLLGKLLVLRNVVLRDYVIGLTMIVLAFMGVNMFLLHRRQLQEN